MSNINVYTNHHWRPFLFGGDVPQETHDWYDWLSETARSDLWLKYKDTYYHLTDFVNLHNAHWGNPDGELVKLGWDGLATDTFFSGVVIKVDDYGENYKIGTIFTKGNYE